MDNQHRKITGYKELSQSQIDTINQIKALGNQVGDLIASLDGPVPGVGDEGAHFPDPRWLAIAKTDLQKGFMALTRAVTSPFFF